MAELPELPKLTKKPPKAVIIGGLAAAALIGWVWWRNRSATDTATTDPTIDPTTGLPWSAEANTGATGGNAGIGAVGGSEPIDAGGDQGIHDQASWTADVIDKLGGTYDSAALYDALGAYLAGQPINNDQAALVRAAWAASGKWPFIPANYTLTASSSTPGSGGATQVTPATPTATNVTRATVSLTTAAIPGATSYEWAVNGTDHAHTTAPAYRYSAKPGTTYTFSVRAIVGGHDTRQSGSITVTTKE